MLSSRNLAYVILLSAMFWTNGVPAEAGEAAAIVEDISGSVEGVQPMDILEEGQVIKLPQGARIILGYMVSCVRETITGGTVTIGSEKSTVEKGTREVEDVDCDGGRAVRTSNNAADVAGAVFRKGPAREPLPKPEWTIYGTSPLFRFSSNIDTIKIKRLDKEEDALDIKVGGSWVDTAKAGLELEPSGLYAVSAGDSIHILKVSPLAEPDVPVLSRLVPM